MKYRQTEDTKSHRLGGPLDDIDHIDRHGHIAIGNGTTDEAPHTETREPPTVAHIKDSYDRGMARSISNLRSQLTHIGIERSVVSSVPNTEPRCRVQRGESGKDQEESPRKIV